MPKVDFSQIDDVQGFEPLPEGQYVCRVEEITTTTTKSGDELWKLRLEVVDGPFDGRYVFDNMVFSPAAMCRVKLICRCLGVDVEGAVDLTPDHLLGRRSRVTVYVDEYEDFEGNVKPTNVVPFGGYEAADESTTEVSR